MPDGGAVFQWSAAAAVRRESCYWVGFLWHVVAPSSNTFHVPSIEDESRPSRTYRFFSRQPRALPHDPTRRIGMPLPLHNQLEAVITSTASVRRIVSVVACAAIQAPGMDGGDFSACLSWADVGVCCGLLRLSPLSSICCITIRLYVVQ